MHSHKFNGPAVKYEVGVCLKTGWIVWINEPFAGSKNDGTILKEELSNLLHDDEAVEVDRGYRGDAKMKLPDMGFTWIERKMKSNAQAQHETGMMQEHKICFEAVAVITQLKFASGENTFEDGLEYDPQLKVKDAAALVCEAPPATPASADNNDFLHFNLLAQKVLIGSIPEEAIDESVE
eukprot:jgi/Psemu1/6939/gm1.6939_g